MYDLKEKDNLANQVEQNLTQAKKKQQMRAYDSKLEDLAKNIEETIAIHGEDYFMVEILTMFLDIAIKMKEVMQMMNSMNMVMELFGDAVTFIDESMALQSNIMQDTGKIKYNLWTRLTGYFQTKRIIRNNVNRVRAMSRNILIKYKMASDMVVALQGVSTELKTMTRKMGKKNQKLMSKKGSMSGDSSSMSQYSDACKYLEERRAAKGSDAGTSANTGRPASSYKPAPSSASGELDLTGI